MFAGLYGDLPASKELEEEPEPQFKPKPTPKGGGLYGDLYGDSAGDETAAKEPDATVPAPDAAAPAAPKPDATTISAAPTVPALKKLAEPDTKKQAWGVPKFMPQQRKKRPAPPAAGRNTAAALAAKKQKLQQQQQTPKPEAEVRQPLLPAATGGLYTYEVQDEYDPRRPHDYDALVALRKKQREIDAKMLELKEIEERERREREDEARARGESPPPDTGFHIPERLNERTSIAPDRSIAPIAAGRGRGRGVNLPAWMTKGEDGSSAGRGAGGGSGGQLQSGFSSAPPVEPEQSVAEKMMAKMGYRAGAGLGREEQGIRASLMVQKTDRNSGVITQAEPTTPALPGPGEPSSQPTRVVMLLNMVGPGEVDSELESDTREECANYGAVRRVAIREVTSVPAEEAVRIFVQFDSQEAATKAKVDLDGRFFGGRTVVSSYYDEGHFEAGRLIPPAVAAREARSRNRFG